MYFPNFSSKIRKIRFLDNDWKIKKKPEKFQDYDFELLLNILAKSSNGIKNIKDNELFVDENWKINTKNMYNRFLSIIPIWKE